MDDYSSFDGFDFFESYIRMKLIAKVCIQQAIIEHRLAQAQGSAPMKMDLSKLKPLVDQVDLYRVPEKKDESGWRGPCELLDIAPHDNSATVKHQSLPYIVPLRHIRPHLMKALLTFMKCATVFFQLHVYEHAKWPTDSPHDLHHALHKLLDMVDSTSPGTLRYIGCLLYTSPSPRDGLLSRMPSSA